MTGSEGFKHLTTTQDQQAKGETPDNEKVTALLAQTSCLSKYSLSLKLCNIYGYYELIKMTLNPQTVVWPNLPQKGNRPNGQAHTKMCFSLAV